jgi:hypothetical protein
LKIAELLKGRGACLHILTAAMLIGSCAGVRCGWARFISRLSNSSNRDAPDFLSSSESPSQKKPQDVVVGVLGQRKNPIPFFPLQKFNPTSKIHLLSFLLLHSLFHFSRPRNVTIRVPLLRRRMLRIQSIQHARFYQPQNREGDAGD